MEPNDQGIPEVRGEMVRSLVLLLVLGGLALGATLAMIQRERTREAELRGEKHLLETRVAMTEARQGEVLSFLGQPATQWVKLTGQKDWAGWGMTVGWNVQTREAVVLSERLPPAGQQYQLYGKPSQGGTAVELGAIDAGAPTDRTFVIPKELGDQPGFEVMTKGRVIFSGQ